MSTLDLLKLNISELSQLIQSKKISPVELTSATLQHIEALNPEHNAYVTVMAEQAMQTAHSAEKAILAGDYKGPLHGVPLSLKDAIFTKGVRTTFGSETHKDFVPDHDAHVVTRLYEAGAIILGKTNMQSFALGPTGDKSCFGPVRNPRSPGKITAGSSSGSAGALASYQCFGSIGTDTGGSVRMPASACAVVGMKPTFGKVSKHGSLPLCWTLDHLGPMTRTVEDNALMLNAIVGFDEKDPYSVESVYEDYSLGIKSGVKDKVIGVPTNFYFDIVESGVQRVFDETVNTLSKLGAKIVPIALPEMDELLIAQQLIFACESYSTIKDYLQQCPEKIDIEVRNRAIAGLLLDSETYIMALQARNKLISQHRLAFNQVDALITPTLPILPSDVGQRDVMIDGQAGHTRILSRLTGPSNTTGFPAMSVPAGFSAEGLPVGVQLIGKPHSERQLYTIAYAIEQHTPSFFPQQ